MKATRLCGTRKPGSTPSDRVSLSPALLVRAAGSGSFRGSIAHVSAVGHDRAPPPGRRNLASRGEDCERTMCGALRDRIAAGEVLDRRQAVTCHKRAAPDRAAQVSRDLQIRTLVRTVWRRPGRERR